MFRCILHSVQSQWDILERGFAHERCFASIVPLNSCCLRRSVGCRGRSPRWLPAVEHTLICLHIAVALRVAGLPALGRFPSWKQQGNQSISNHPPSRGRFEDCQQTTLYPNLHLFLPESGLSSNQISMNSLKFEERFHKRQSSVD